MTKRMLCPQRYVIPCVAKKRRLDENAEEAENFAARPRPPPTVRGVCLYGADNTVSMSVEASLSGKAQVINLSPLHFSRIGPVELDGGERCELFANFVVGSVVHECEYNRAASRLLSEFFSRRAMLYASKVLHTTKYKNRSTLVVDRTPFAFVWKERLVNNVEAVRSLIAELYLQIARRSDIFRSVSALLDKGVNVVITGDTEKVSDTAPSLSHEILASICWERALCEELNASRYSLAMGGFFLFFFKFYIGNICRNAGKS